MLDNPILTRRRDTSHIQQDYGVQIREKLSEIIKRRQECLREEREIVLASPSATGATATKRSYENQLMLMTSDVNIF
jgi:hypothetical protein